MHEATSILVYSPPDEPVGHVESVLDPAEYSIEQSVSLPELFKYLEGRRFDVVICPVTTTEHPGRQLVRMIKDTDPSLAVILVGSVTDRGTLQQAIDAGASAHVDSVDEGLREKVSDITTWDSVQREVRRHRQLENTVRDLGRRLFDAATIDRIEELVHERMMDLGLYRFVWIGEPGDDTHVTLHVPLSGDIKVTDLPLLDVESGRKAFDRAIDEGSVQVVEGTPLSRRPPAGEQAGSGGRAVRGPQTAIVPFHAEDTLIGVAFLTTDRTIDSAEEAVLQTLGRLVGSAMWMVEVRSELERAKQRVEEFSGIVAHEIRNPLAIAMTQLELIREGSNGEAVERVESSLDRIDRHVGNLMTLAKGLDVDSVSDRSLEETAVEAWESVRTTDAELVIESSKPISADHDLLIQLFANLFRNAVEQGEDGDVTVRVGMMDEGFFIEDNGPGIPPDQRETVFEWGYTGTAGLGIGLTVVKEICRAHGWRIGVTGSTLGGARFEISTGEKNDAAPSPTDRLAELFSSSARYRP